MWKTKKRLICQYCKKEIITNRRNYRNKFCNRSCYLNYHSKKIGICKCCENRFIKDESKRRYCSRKCYHNYRKGKIRKIRYCLNCNGIIYRRHNKKFCNRKCFSKYPKSNETKEKLRIQIKNKKYGFKIGHKINLGRKRSLESINKIRNKLIGHIVTEATRKKLKKKNMGKRSSINTEFTKEKRAELILPKRDTKIEVKIQNFLKGLGIEHYTHFWVSEIKNKYQCDIFIPVQNGILQKTIIECDGDFIHCNPKKYPSNFIRFPNAKKVVTAQEVWEKDDIRTKELIEKGFKVLRLWENEINEMDLDNFKERLRCQNI